MAFIKGGDLMQDGVCLCLEELLRIVESSGTGLSLGSSYGRIQFQVSRKEALKFLAKYIRE